MNLLIIGGLLVVAAAAILGAILLGMGEQRVQARSIASSAPAPIPNSAPPLTESSQLVTRKLEEPVSTRSTALSMEEEIRATSAAEQHRSALLNGQFRELAGEMRTLHQQAWQLEQRLSLLTEMVDHMEREQSGHSGFEEGPHPASDSTLA